MSHAGRVMPPAPADFKVSAGDGSIIWLGHSFNIRFWNQKTKDKSNANAAKHPFDALVSGIIQIWNARMQKCQADKPPSKAGHTSDNRNNFSPSGKAAFAIKPNPNRQNDGEHDANQQTDQM